MTTSEPSVSVPVRVPLGAILCREFGLAGETLQAALAQQPKERRRIGELLIEMGAITPLVLAKALACQLKLEVLETLAGCNGDPGLLAQVPVSFLKQNELFPLEKGAGPYRVALADPFRTAPLNDLAALTGEGIEPVLATAEEIRRALNRSIEQQADKTRDFIDEMEENLGEAREPSLEPADLLDGSDEAPIIRFVNSLIAQGYKERSSDIHIEPFENEMVVRYRIDGVLYETHRPPRQAHAGILSRIKIMANLNIAEKRLPQDGRFRVRIAGKDIDVRVSTLPTAFGERAVLRLLDKAGSILSLEELGMAPELLEKVSHLTGKNHGIFLVTGPTGSGKTTTLYAALSRLNTREKNIITVEDPIEYQLAGVGQIQVNPKIDLTFANGLRSILRQDPDVIMIGEIRDRETAEIAIQSALTGHMVFSTLHTNDSAGALTRLVEMGIEPFLAASSIVGILAQRLVRRLCPACREVREAGPDLVRELTGNGMPQKTTFFHGRGCPQCLGIGYRGRSGIYELLVLDDEIRDLLLQKKDAAVIKAAAVRKGMNTLRRDGVAKASAGATSLEEVLRVTQEEE